MSAAASVAVENLDHLIEKVANRTPATDEEDEIETLGLWRSGSSLNPTADNLIGEPGYRGFLRGLCAVEEEYFATVMPHHPRREYYARKRAENRQRVKDTRGHTEEDKPEPCSPDPNISEEEHGVRFRIAIGVARYYPLPDGASDAELEACRALMVIPLIKDRKKLEREIKKHLYNYARRERRRLKVQKSLAGNEEFGDDGAGRQQVQPHNSETPAGPGAEQSVTLAGLNMLERHTLALRLENYTQEDIALGLGVNRATVSRILARISKKIGKPAQNPN